MARLFVAVRPPDVVQDAVAALDRPELPGVRWTRPDQWHVTLRFLGQVAEPGEVVERLGGIDVPGRDVRVGPATELLGSRVLMVPVSDLGDLAGAVTELTAEVGQPPEDRPFVGHLTLARSKGRNLRSVVGQEISESFPVDEIEVIESRLHPDGARYETLAVLPLR